MASKHVPVSSDDWFVVVLVSLALLDIRMRMVGICCKGNKLINTGLQEEFQNYSGEFLQHRWSQKTLYLVRKKQRICLCTSLQVLVTCREASKEGRGGSSGVNFTTIKQDAAHGGRGGSQEATVEIECRIYHLAINNSLLMLTHANSFEESSGIWKLKSRHFLAHI